MTVLRRDSAALVVIDVQEAFRPAIDGFDDLVANVARLATGARVLELPAVVTEQYPRGLGRTVAELDELLDDPLEKVVFSAARADGFDLGGRDQALVCGIETHVCVAQTVLDLLAGGVEVHVVADACSSRSAANRERGLARMEHAGATITSTEMALFELVERAGTDTFKAIQGLVR